MLPHAAIRFTLAPTPAALGPATPRSTQPTTSTGPDWPSPTRHGHV